MGSDPASGDPGTPPGSGDVDALDSFTSALGFQHAHGWGATLLVGGIAIALGWYAAWLFADVVVRPLTFVLVALASAYAVYARPTTRGAIVRGLYGLAILLVLTPVWLSLSFLVLPHGTEQVADPVPFVFTVADLVLLLAFGLLAAIPAGIGLILERRR